MTLAPIRRAARWLVPFVPASLALAALSSTGWSQTPPAPPPATAEVQRISDAFTSVAAQVLPAVVSIRVESERAQPEGADMPFGFPFPFGAQPRAPRGGNVVRGTGSGVVVRPDGVIVTNNHVVEGAQRIRVHFRDGRTLAARVLGTDPSTDLAVIKVDAQGLPAAAWGDSSSARVGEWVLAVGAPFGLEASVTHGVVSAMGRGNLGENPIEDYLQTDASINPGNSGGPLVNLRGEVLGINTMIVRQANNIGFAVPSRLARSVVEQIAATGHVTRGWIGVGVQELNSELADTMNLQPESGALVSQVDPRSPASRAVQLGDVITSVNGARVLRGGDLVREVVLRQPGERLELTLLRNGQPLRATVVTGRRPEPERAEAPASQAVPMDPGGGIGMEVAPLHPVRARQVGVTGGVVVTVVEPGGVADRAGLRRGDVILRADGREVRGPGDLVEATQDGRAAVLVRRNDGQLFVPLNMRR
jgi:serine protease Do